MGKHKPRYLIKRECDRASGNLDMAMNHLLTIRQQCQEGKRPELMVFIDRIAEGMCAIQQTIEAFKAMVDGKIPVSSEPEDT